jgi:hypothetical protein
MMVFVRLGQTILILVNTGSRLEGGMCINFVNTTIYNGCKMQISSAKRCSVPYSVKGRKAGFIHTAALKPIVLLTLM